MAEEAHRTKRRIKTDLKLVGREVPTPSGSEDSRSSKRHRYCTPTCTVEAVTSANLSCPKTEDQYFVLVVLSSLHEATHCNTVQATACGCVKLRR